MSYDEGSAFYTAKQPLFLALTNQWAVHSIAAVLGVKLTTSIFGDAAWAVRLSMLIAGIGLIFMSYWSAVIWSKSYVVAALTAAAVVWPLVAPNRLAREFNVEVPDQAWVADIT